MLMECIVELMFYCEYVGNVIEPFDTLSDSSKIKKMLGWEPTGDFKKFLKEFFN